MKTMTTILAVWVTGMATAFAAPTALAPEAKAVISKPVRVVLIGASIGKSWNLPELPQRLHLDGYVFEALQVWEFDKSEMVEEMLMRPARKFRFTPSYFKSLLQPVPQPADLVILKECSSYFPGNLQMQRKKELLQQWVQQVREKKIAVMVTTVAPITRVRAERDGSTKQQAIREFNDWIRAYASAQGLALLDLEKALRADDKDRYLRDDLTSGDGSHLNRKAYDILDKQMWDTVCTSSAGGQCS
jgi:hypothetical protein